MEHEVSKAPTFKTIDKSGTNWVSFKTIEDTSNNPIHFQTFQEWVKARKANKLIFFKTFDNWVKARTANCDMALKDALSFMSEKKSALDVEKESQQGRPVPPERSNPSNTEPSSQWTDSPSDSQQPRETPMDRGEIPMGCRRGESTMEPMRTQQPREIPMDRGEITMEHRRRELMMEPMRTSPVQPRYRQKAKSTALLHHHTTWFHYSSGQISHGKGSKHSFRASIHYSTSRGCRLQLDPVGVWGIWKGPWVWFFWEIQLSTRCSSCSFCSVVFLLPSEQATKSNWVYLNKSNKC